MHPDGFRAAGADGGSATPWDQRRGINVALTEIASRTNDPPRLGQRRTSAQLVVDNGFVPVAKANG